MKGESKNIGTLLFAVGLILLLLISPCNVRNFIQEELGLPQTEVANKSKTYLSNSNCDSFSKTTFTLVKPSIDFAFPSGINKPTSILFPFTLSLNQFAHTKRRIIRFLLFPIISYIKI